MAFIPVPNTAEIVLQGNTNGHAAYLTLYAEQGEPFSPGDLEALLTAVGSWWDEDLSTIVTTSLNMPSIKVTALDSDSAPTAVKTDMAETTGQVAEVPVTDQAAAVVSFYTQNRGRSFRGRNYVPSVSRSNLLNTSLWTSAFAEALTDVYGQLADKFNTTPFTHVVVSRYGFGSPRLIGITTPVQSYVGKQLIGTQRRRIIGVGI